MKRKYLLLVAVLLVHALHAQVRQNINFNAGWKFYLGNDSMASNENYDDKKWRVLNLPHDWSIEGNFSKDHPATNQGGALPGGIGWYRKTFTLPASAKNKKVCIEFDGVYRNSEVWINGHYLGKRPNGYISFEYDLTPYLKFGNEKNVIAVKVDNAQQPNSRWYSGSGIYRDVRLIVKNEISFKKNGLFIMPAVIDGEGSLNIHAWIQAPEKSNAGFTVKYELYDAAGRLVKDESYHSMILYNLQGDNTKYLFTYNLKNPVLWSTGKPYLYTLKATLLIDGKKTDEVITTVGVRQFSFDAQKGFFLNNQPLKIKGVCIHHDLGALGAAFNYRAAERQLQILKDMGCNAIRTAHNPPATEFLDLCDKMGFLIMDEAFDMWQKKKNKFDYSIDFKQWHEKDLETMVLRDRNHPSVIMWSIGNEIREQFDSSGIELTKQMAEVVKMNDPTRPVISALTENIPEKNFIYRSGALDILGFNYKQFDYVALPQRFPGQKLIAAETVSALATRGVYDQPADSIHVWPPDSKPNFAGGNKDLTCAAYDNTFAYWGTTHENAWLTVKKNDFMAGCFVWSGFDFIGEPVPYAWPARSSYYGIVDLAGFPKDVYYMYQSEWTTKPVLHLFPHWNWEHGKIIDVWAYYNNADEVELFLNGRSLGIRKKTADTLHVMWKLPFEPGTLKAISRKNGKTVLIKTIKTAGAAAKIELTADRKIIKAGGNDLSFITAKIVDKEGNLVPDATGMLQFSITGNALLAATDNGYQADTASFTNNKRRAWKGMALAIVRSSAKKGNSTLTVRAAGLPSATVAFKIVD
jgi:beta-galactosidase